MPNNESITPKRMNLHNRIEYNGHHINIYYDESSESPREWSNLGTFYTAHRRYRPEKEFDEHFDIDEVCVDGRPGHFRKAFLRDYIALNIYLYDHSGQAVSSAPFSCRWDSGWFGMVAVSVEAVKKEFGWEKITSYRRRKIKGYLQNEIDTYNEYLHGEVYGFQVTPAGDDSEVLDSCWGYFGDSGLKQLKDECRDMIDNIITRQKEQERAECLRIFGPELPFPEYALSTI